jgi:hypothetical protein
MVEYQLPFPKHLRRSFHQGVSETIHGQVPIVAQNRPLECQWSAGDSCLPPATPRELHQADPAGPYSIRHATRPIVRLIRTRVRSLGSRGPVSGLLLGDERASCWQRLLLQKGDTAKRAPPEQLDEVFLDCQIWYNDVVKTIADIVAVISNKKMDDTERHAIVDGIQLVYQNSQTYVPKVLSSRKLLSRFDDTEGVVKALDDFLSHIYVQPTDRMNSPYCRPPLDFIRTPSNWQATDQEKPAGSIVEDNITEATIARDYMYMSLGRISHSLQNLSDVVSETKLLS